MRHEQGTRGAASSRALAMLFGRVYSSVFRLQIGITPFLHRTKLMHVTQSHDLSCSGLAASARCLSTATLFETGKSSSAHLYLSPA